ncbi:MAG: ABC transporter ATP-binding protein [Longimicrobiales bacterium]
MRSRSGAPPGDPAGKPGEDSRRGAGAGVDGPAGDSLRNRGPWGPPLVRVRNLKVHFPILRGILRRQVGAVRAVDGVSFQVREGETLGLVGESGSGKSTTGRAMLRLEEPTGGEARFLDADLISLEPRELRRARRHMQMIFQDPHASLNPRRSVGQALREPLEIHRIGTPEEREHRVAELLGMVGLSPGVIRRYPHEFSGGQLQRIGIARALATNPRFVVADEPISALDVSIQAQIVNLLAKLKAELGLTYLFIAHDLSMVRHISDRVAVMYLGRIVELGGGNEIFQRPLHPYTKALIAAIPVPDPEREARRKPIPLPGDIPSPADPPPGCRFHTRCPFPTEICLREDPELRQAGGEDPSHVVACHHAEELV